jgi:hypothetical protein
LCSPQVIFESGVAGEVKLAWQQLYYRTIDEFGPVENYVSRVQSGAPGVVVLIAFFPSSELAEIVWRLLNAGWEVMRLFYLKKKCCLVRST